MDCFTYLGCFLWDTGWRRWHISLRTCSVFRSQTRCVHKSIGIVSEIQADHIPESVRIGMHFLKRAFRQKHSLSECDVCPCLPFSPGWKSGWNQMVTRGNWLVKVEERSLTHLVNCNSVLCKVCLFICGRNSQCVSTLKIKGLQ